jgi:hypothetical protein
LALSEYLRSRDVPCPLCHYNLRGLSATRCPECGRELRLGVWLAEPRQAAWVVALVPVLLGAGIGLLVLLATLLHGWSTAEGAVVSATYIYFLACIPAALLLIMRRRRFLQLGEAFQWIIAAAACLVQVAALLLVMGAMS